MLFTTSLTSPQHYFLCRSAVKSWREEKNTAKYWKRNTRNERDDLLCVCVSVWERERGSCRPTGCWTESLDFDFAKKQKQPDLMRQLCASSLHYSHKNKRVFSVYLASNSRNKLLHRAANRAVFICLNRQCIKWEHTLLQAWLYNSESATLDWGCMKVKSNHTEITRTERPFFGKPKGKVTF